METEINSAVAAPFTITLAGREISARPLSIAEYEDWSKRTKAVWRAFDEIGGIGVYQAIAYGLIDIVNGKSSKSQQDIIAENTTIGSWMCFMIEAVPAARKCIERYPGIKGSIDTDNVDEIDFITSFWELWNQNHPSRSRRRTPAA